MRQKLTLALGILLALLAACTDDENTTEKDITLSGGTQTNQVIYADQTTPSGGGISFTAAADWTARVVDLTPTKADTSSPDWLTLSAYSGGPGQHTLTLTLTENRTGQDRSARIEISCGADVITITVEQKSTTQGGDNPATQSTLLSRIEATYVSSGNPEDYDRIILTFQRDSEGRVTEMHDIAYVGDEQGYYSDGTYRFTYEPGRILLNMFEDYSTPEDYVFLLNEAGDVYLIYQQRTSSSTLAWLMEYDADRRLQRILENYCYEPDSSGDDDDESNVEMPGFDSRSASGFDREIARFVWEDGNLMRSVNTTSLSRDEDYTTWTYSDQPNLTPGFDFNMFGSYSLFGYTEMDYSVVTNMLFGLKMLGQSSKNLVDINPVDWAYHQEETNPSSPEPTTETTHDDRWQPFVYTLDANGFLQRATAHCVLRTIVTDIATGNVIWETETYEDEEYLFFY